MPIELNILKPTVVRPGYVEEELERWRQEQKQEEETEFRPEEINVRFPHDPNWRNRIFSIQGILDARLEFDWRKPSHWLWKTVEIIFMIAQVAFFAGATLAAMYRLRGFG